MSVLYSVGASYEEKNTFTDVMPVKFLYKMNWQRLDKNIKDT